MAEIPSVPQGAPAQVGPFQAISGDDMFNHRLRCIPRFDTAFEQSPEHVGILRAAGEGDIKSSEIPEQRAVKDRIASGQGGIGCKPVGLKNLLGTIQQFSPGVLIANGNSCRHALYYPAACAEAAPFPHNVQ